MQHAALTRMPSIYCSVKTLLLVPRSWQAQRRFCIVPSLGVDQWGQGSLERGLSPEKFVYYMYRYVVFDIQPTYNH